MTEAVDDGRFERAIAAIDAANAADPNRLSIAGEAGPKELVHAKLVTAWITRLVAEPDQALLLAARAHHLKRWQRPRSDHPEGRAGYHRWRRELQEFHAAESAKILAAHGIDAVTIARVGDLIRKRGLGSDPGAQAIEDALCLVFIETQLADFAARHEDERVIGILVKSLGKMSPAGRDRVAEIALRGAEARLVAAASERYQSSGGSAGQDQEPPRSESSDGSSSSS